MNVVVIAPLAAERIAEIAALDSRLRVENAWELFAPELVADWPTQTVEWYLPRQFREVTDSPEKRERREELLANTEVLLIGFPFPTRVVARAPRLRLVHQLPAGVSNLTRGDLWGSSVPVTSGRGVNRSLPIAEWVLGAALMFGKDFPRAFAQRAAGRFDRAPYRSRQVAGKTMGIVGLGGIGRHVARLASGLGLRVVGMRRSPDPVEHVTRLYRPDELHALLGESDVVVLAAQHTNETHHLMNEAAFAALKPGGYLINVARGELIDEAALVAALRSGQVGGFAADVYAGEFEHGPPAVLLAFENVMLTPHTSGQSEQPATDSFAVFQENLRRFLAGEPLLNLVDWERGY